MKTNKISSKQLADTIGVHERLIRTWKSGDSEPRFINGIYLIMALSKLTGQNQDIIYKEISSCILKDN